MQFKVPKNTKEYYWTNHAVFKMRCYGLSVQKVLSVIKKPERKEEGIVKNTVAVMQPVNPKIQSGKKIWKQEVWVMYQTKVESRKPARNASHIEAGGSKVQNDLTPTLSLPCRQADLKRRGGIKIISAWRYPGVSPNKNPIPSEILAEIGEII